MTDDPESHRLHAEEKPAAIWQPSRKRKGTVFTALGFGSGDPCPRMCGGTLVEANGSLTCSDCDFHYSDDTPQSQPLPIASQPLPASKSTEPEAPVNASGALPSEEIQRLYQEIEQLKEDNQRLLRLVYQLMQQATPAASEWPGQSQEPSKEEILLTLQVSDSAGASNPPIEQSTTPQASGDNPVSTPESQISETERSDILERMDFRDWEQMRRVDSRPWWQRLSKKKKP